MQHIYLDNNATTPILPEVAEAMRETALAAAGNPASQHEPGRRARRLLEEARDQIAHMLGARTGSGADRLIFTSGGTEANNLAVWGLARGRAALRGGGRPGRLVISAVEHPCVVEPAELLARHGWDLARLPVDAEGVARVEMLAELLDDAGSRATQLVSLMGANHETGVLQPVAEAARLCRAADVPLHTDAVQLAGKLPIDFAALDVDALSISAHKFHGPPGIGGLLVRHDGPLEPILAGSRHAEHGLRPGTPSVALAVGMQRALAAWHREHAAQTARLAALHARLEAGLRAALPDCRILGDGADRLPQTTCVAFAGLERQALVMALDLAGVACATGAACASGSSEPSPVLLAMGVARPLVEGAVRLSLGHLNTAAEVDLAVCRISQVCHDLRRGKTARKLA